MLQWGKKKKKEKLTSIKMRSSGKLDVHLLTLNVCGTKRQFDACCQVQSQSEGL